jgi:hypothetical protein
MVFPILKRIRWRRSHFCRAIEVEIANFIVNDLTVLCIKFAIWNWLDHSGEVRHLPSVGELLIWRRHMKSDARTYTALQIEALKKETTYLFGEQAKFLAVCRCLAESIVEGTGVPAAIAAAAEKIGEAAPNYSESFSDFVVNAMSEPVGDKTDYLPASLRRAIDAGSRAGRVSAALETAAGKVPREAIEALLDPEKLMSTRGGMYVRKTRVYELINDAYHYPRDPEAMRLKDEAHEAMQDWDKSSGNADYYVEKAEEKIDAALKILRANKKKTAKKTDK